MQKLPKTAPITMFKRNQDEVLMMMDTEPVVLMNRSTPRAVLISPEMWNAMAERLAYLESMVAADAASRRVWSGEYDTAADVERVMGK